MYRARNLTRSPTRLTSTRQTIAYTLVGICDASKSFVALRRSSTLAPVGRRIFMQLQQHGILSPVRDENSGFSNDIWCNIRLVTDTYGRVPGYAPLCDSWFEGSIPNTVARNYPPVGGGCWIDSHIASAS